MLLKNIICCLFLSKACFKNMLRVSSSIVWNEVHLVDVKRPLLYKAMRCSAFPLVDPKALESSTPLTPLCFPNGSLTLRRPLNFSQSSTRFSIGLVTQKKLVMDRTLARLGSTDLLKMLSYLELISSERAFPRPNLDLTFSNFAFLYLAPKIAREFQIYRSFSQHRSFALCHPVMERALAQLGLTKFWLVLHKQKTSN